MKLRQDVTTALLHRLEDEPGAWSKFPDNLADPASGSPLTFGTICYLRGGRSRRRPTAVGPRRRGRSPRHAGPSGASASTAGWSSTAPGPGTSRASERRACMSGTRSGPGRSHRCSKKRIGSGHPIICRYSSTVSPGGDELQQVSGLVDGGDHAVGGHRSGRERCRRSHAGPRRHPGSHCAQHGRAETGDALAQCADLGIPLSVSVQAPRLHGIRTLAVTVGRRWRRRGGILDGERARYALAVGAPIKCQHITRNDHPYEALGHVTYMPVMIGCVRGRRSTPFRERQRAVPRGSRGLSSAMRRHWRLA